MLSDDWEHVEGEFTSRGGELFHWASDNSLCIVPGAIPVGETWRIRGQMHTLLDQFDAYLSQCKNYNAIFSDNVRQYCSSVFELQIISASDAQDQPILLPRSKEFNKPVSITIRYAASESSRQDLRVFCVHDNNVIQEIKIGDANDESCVAPYFLLDNDYVTIITKHFVTTSSAFAANNQSKQASTSLMQLSTAEFTQNATVNTHIRHT
jgi:hypothetical protein